MINRRSFISAVPGAILSASASLRPQSRPSMIGVWTGAVTAKSATIKALTKVPGQAVTISMTADTAASIEQATAADRDGVAVFDLAGLAPRTRYSYSISVPGESHVDGSLRTFADGPFSFRLVFASCASTGSTSPVFTAMRHLAPDLFIHLGDLHYENITVNDVRRFGRACAQVLGSSTQSALFRSVPLAYTWDDHDFGADDSDRTSPSRPAAQLAYRSFVPHYRLPDADGSIYHAFTIGRVRVVMLDTRSARAPRRSSESERTMLGPAQLAWLERELQEAEAAPLVVLVNSVPWITKRNEASGDGWAPYAQERRHIADLIVRHNLTRRLVMLSGDGHMLAMDDGTHSQYSTLPNAPSRGFVIAHAAPMDRWPSKKGGPYSHGEVARSGQFGVMEVDDDGRLISVRLRGMRGSKPVSGMDVAFSPVS